MSNSTISPLGSFSIRTAVPSDAEELSYVHLITWLDTYNGILSQQTYSELYGKFRLRRDYWRKNILEKVFFDIFVAESSTGIIGFCVSGKATDESFAGSGMTDPTNILPNWQRKGVGQALISKSLADLKARGYNKSYTWVILGNQKAISFYSKIGAVMDNSKIKPLGINGDDCKQVAMVWHGL